MKKARGLRQRRGMSLDYVASKTSWRKGHLSQWEQGKRGASIESSKSLLFFIRARLMR